MVTKGPRSIEYDTESRLYGILWRRGFADVLCTNLGFPRLLLNGLLSDYLEASA